jgi:hypothetical protein
MGSSALRLADIVANPIVLLDACLLLCACSSSACIGSLGSMSAPSCCLTEHSERFCTGSATCTTTGGRTMHEGEGCTCFHSKTTRWPTATRARRCGHSRPLMLGTLRALLVRLASAFHCLGSIVQLQHCTSSTSVQDDAVHFTSCCVPAANMASVPRNLDKKSEINRAAFRSFRGACSGTLFGVQLSSSSQRAAPELTAVCTGSYAVQIRC